jgi:hypothetical protein
MHSAQRHSLTAQAHTPIVLYRQLDHDAISGWQLEHDAISGYYPLLSASISANCFNAV